MASGGACRQEKYEQLKALNAKLRSHQTTAKSHPHIVNPVGGRFVRIIWTRSLRQGEPEYSFLVTLQVQTKAGPHTRKHIHTHTHNTQHTQHTTHTTHTTIAILGGHTKRLRTYLELAIGLVFFKLTGHLHFCCQNAKCSRPDMSIFGSQAGNCAYSKCAVHNSST